MHVGSRHVGPAERDVVSQRRQQREEMKVVGVAGATEVVTLDSFEIEFNWCQARQAMVLAVVELGNVFKGNARQMGSNEFLQSFKRRFLQRHAECSEVSGDDFGNEWLVQHQCFSGRLSDLSWDGKRWRRAIGIPRLKTAKRRAMPFYPRTAKVRAAGRE